MREARKRIVGSLYDGILSPQDWHGAIDTMRHALGAGVFNCFTLRTLDGQVIDSVDNLAGVGIREEKLREYETHYLGEDPRMAVLMGLPVGRIMLDHEHISMREISRNVVYADLLRPNGFQHTLGALVRDEGGSRDFLGFIRPADHAPYGACDKELVERLMPDLSRAARLRARTGQLARHAALGLAALDAIPQGIAVVDAECRIQYSNRCADRLLGNTRVLRVRYGRLQCDEVQANAQLQQQVARACGAAGAGMAGAQSLAGDGERLVITVLPLKASHPAATHWQAPLALVVLVDPAAPGGASRI